MVHHHLESCRRVAESKKYNQRFVKAVFDVEHGFLFIAFLNVDVIVALLHIEFGEVFHSFEFVHEI